MDITWIINKYNEQLCAPNFDNVDKIDQSLEKYCWGGKSFTHFSFSTVTKTEINKRKAVSFFKYVYLIFTGEKFRDE